MSNAFMNYFYYFDSPVTSLELKNKNMEKFIICDCWLCAERRGYRLISLSVSVSNIFQRKQQTDSCNH